LAQGDVLEIGAGSGANFLHYDPAKVRTLYALEPNPGMIRLAERQRRRTGMAIEFLDHPGERIPLDEGSMDTVVSTFTLCTIPGVEEAIRGIGRVLRSSGRLIFFELMRSPDPAVRRWQQWWEPRHHQVYAGLSLTRDIPALLTEGGFQLERMDTAYLARFPKSWTYCCWGTALPYAHKPPQPPHDASAPPQAVRVDGIPGPHTCPKTYSPPA
jgi:SAM-dependent methyltransferase